MSLETYVARASRAVTRAYSCRVVSVIVQDIAEGMWRTRVVKRGIMLCTNGIYRYVDTPCIGKTPCIPSWMAEGILGALDWKRGASGSFRSVCKGWQEAHDGALLCLTLKVPSGYCQNEIAAWCDEGSVGGTHVSGFYSLLGKCHRIKAIYLNHLPYGQTRAGDHLLSEILRKLGALDNLRSLTFQGNSNMTDAGATLLLAPLIGLTSLDLATCSFTKFTARGMMALAGLTALTTLSMFCNHSHGVVSAGVMALAGLTNLTSLQLSLSAIDDPSSDPQGMSAQAMTALSPLTALTDLNFTYYCTDDGLRALCDKEPITCIK